MSSSSVKLINLPKSITGYKRTQDCVILSTLEKTKETLSRTWTCFFLRTLLITKRSNKSCHEFLSHNPFNSHLSPIKTHSHLICFCCKNETTIKLLWKINIIQIFYAAFHHHQQQPTTPQTHNIYDAIIRLRITYVVLLSFCLQQQLPPLFFMLFHISLPCCVTTLNCVIVMMIWMLFFCVCQILNL